MRREIFRDSRKLGFKEPFPFSHSTETTNRDQDANPSHSRLTGNDRSIDFEVGIGLLPAVLDPRRGPGPPGS
jgi:hypothetical protein